MSGIVGIVNFDGAPVDRALLTRMTNFMKFRGPDEQRIWVEGNVGFGHTLLRTTFESEHEHQPFTLDGKTWIVADARVDAQSDLIAKLSSRGENVERGATDVELLLRAYRVWGENCVEHLLGDFSFAVCDSPGRRLFCARDHLGVKPFFYAQIGERVIFSNTLDCIREHPAVSDKLNDLAIADFLLFDLNQDPKTTSFADIQRVPPACSTVWSGSSMRMNRYWTMPIDEPIQFRRANDYTDRFRELLDIAVGDRLRTNKIAIFMSGGLDSPALAATACKVLRQRSSECGVRAFTSVIDDLDGGERYYAGLVSHFLGIPVHFRDRAVETIDPNWDITVTIHTPEPVTCPTNLAADHDEYRSVSSYARVLFYGEGPDNALKYEWTAYLSSLAKKRQIGGIAGAVCEHAIRHRRIPLVPTIPRMLKSWRNERSLVPMYPKWLHETFESRMSLRARWEEEKQPFLRPPFHPIRPLAYESFQTPLWERIFRNLDAEGTCAPLETRHPFLDLRLLRYMLAVPAIPWCRAKFLVRRAMQGMLPDAVLRRPKSPLTSDPGSRGMRRLPLLPSRPSVRISKYVNLDRVPKDADNDNSFFINVRPLALNFWLQNLRRRPHGATQEDSCYEFAETAR